MQVWGVTSGKSLKKLQVLSADENYTYLTQWLHCLDQEHHLLNHLMQHHDPPQQHHVHLQQHLVHLQQHHEQPQHLIDTSNSKFISKIV